MQQHEATRSESVPAGAVPAVSPPGFTYVVDDIDELSNSVVDLINEGRLDEAEERCRELREQYPETLDWMMRLAAVYEARKDWKRAADYYRRAADFAAEKPGYDQEMIDDFRNTATGLEKKDAPVSRVVSGSVRRESGTLRYLLLSKRKRASTRFYPIFLTASKQAASVTAV